MNQRLIINWSKSSKKVLPLMVLILLVLTELIAQELTIPEKIAARIHGPFHLRFILQPIMAIIIGWRDGKSDALLGVPPYIFEMFTSKGKRRENLRKGLNSIWKPLTIGVVIDIIVQIILFQSVRIFGALLVGGLLIGLPYSLFRGIGNRLNRQSKRVL
jgi:hypothetical protein